MINHVNNWEKANQEKNNESLTAELERYKERVKTFEQRLNIDLSTREKMIDSQMGDMIKEKLALKQQINSLEQNLSNQIKEKESLLQTFTVFKNESKKKESKCMDKEIDLEKKIKELDNIVYKMGQSAQTMHMLTKPQVFYDNTHKQALGYQNTFYLNKAQRIKPTLYDGSVISSQHAASLVIDDEDTLILEEVSRSKMPAKQNDPISKEKKVNTTLINYVELNKLSEDFGKRSVLQQELIEAPSKLSKVSLVNTSLKKLKFHLSKFDIVVKKRITPDAITEGEWGFEHTKAVFLKEIISFLTILKDIFNFFDRDLLNDVTEVETVFNQMETVVQQCLENDRLIQQIMPQDILLSVINGEFVNLKLQRSESCDKCFDLDAKLSKTLNSYNELLKKYFENNDLKARLQANDNTICKLKEHIKYMRENDKEEKVKQDMDEIETINIELEHSVAKLLFKNEHFHKDIDHLKQIYKDQFDSIKRTRVRTKEHSESLILQLNSKSIKNVDLKAQIQDKVFVISSMINDLRKLKRKENVENAAQISIATTIAPGISNAIDVPSSSYLVKDMLSRLFSGVDLLSRSKDTNLYTNSPDDMLNTSLICLLSKASKTKSWLWHRWLSHLNFGTLNKLAKDGLARGIHNGTEFVNQTLREFYENVRILHETSVARTPQQNGVVERQNQTLVEVARTISRLGLQSMTLATSSSGVVPNPVPQQPFNTPNRNDWDSLFQLMFDEYFNPPSNVFSLVPVVTAPRACDIVGSPSSTTIDQDAPSLSTSSTNQQEQSSIIS
ncbi:integrase, catalytic region, zinc finger, CCHC-type containing protein [Tanacetum coccineum]